MMLVRRMIAVASWFALLGGLAWTGKLDGDDEPTPPPVLPEYVFRHAELPAEIEFNRIGPFPAVIGLAVRDDRDASRVGDHWRTPDSNRAGHLQLRVDRAGGEDLDWDLNFSDLKMIDSIFKEDSAFLILSRTELENEQPGTARVSLEISGTDPAPAGLDRLTIVLGEFREDVVNYVKRDPRPGLVLLAGLAGVFAHVFMILGRLLIPFRADALPDDLF